MKYSINDSLHGFRVTRVREIEDVKGTMVEMIHEKTKAQLIYLDRDECNKTFCIGFQTTPSDDTGVFHILEHSVLNGSRKYPVKEPFVDLLKSSLQTFLNAMTYPDKTIYPVSSRNEKDFLNLMDVYLDAVLHPAIYNNKKIFEQEGWHYELRAEEDEMIYKGVVFNEMKGAFSSVDETIMNAANRILFKDNCYKYVSGGDPEYITDLTYDQFIDTHKKYYHPGNSRIFLDGSMNLDVVLAKIDSFLDEYEEKENTIKVELQKPIPASDIVVEHPIAPNEDPSHKTNLAFAKILCDYTDIKKLLAWQTLTTVLSGSNESPLTKAILEEGLGEDVELGILDEVNQPILLLIVRNTDPDKKEAIEACLNKTISKMVEDGLRTSELVAILNQAEFRYREGSEPSGLIYATESYKSWMYGGDPAMYLECGKFYEELRKEADSGYFENLLKEDLLNRESLNTILVLPSTTLGAKKEQAEKDRLAKIKENFSKEELVAVIDENKELDAWQASEDTEEQKATIPVLKLSDISPKPVKFEGVEKEIAGVPVMVYEEEGSGIVYMNYYFAVNGITKDKLPMLSLFASLLGQLPTKKHSLLELKEAIRKDMGLLVVYPTAFAPKEDLTKCRPMICVTTSCLKQNVEIATNLVLEILQETVFEESMILPYAKQRFETGRQMMISSGHAVSMTRVKSHTASESLFADCTSGISFMQWLKKFIANFDSEKEEFLFEASMYAEHIFTKNRLVASYTGDESVAFKAFVEKLNTEEFATGFVHYRLNDVKDEGLVIPSEVSYSATGFVLPQDAKEVLGSSLVLSSLMTYGYLWNEVRVKGGAYGTALSCNAMGLMTGMSFRDPTPFRSLEIVKGGADFIETLGQMPSLDGNIIGTIASSEPLLPPGARIKNADGNWLRNVSYEDLCDVRKSILTATPNEMPKIAELYREGMKDAPSCVLGPKSIFEEDSDRNVIELF